MLTLNLTHSDTSLAVFDIPPMELPESGNYYRPESQAAGGTKFSTVRRFRAVSYYRNCLPTEAGVASAGLETGMQPAHTYGEVKKLAYVWGCSTNSECPELIGYDDAAVKGVASTPTGTVVLTQAGYVLHAGEFKVFEGVKASDALGIVSIEKHLILYDRNTLYHSNATDSFSFVPTMHEGASSYNISAEIGDIVTVLSYGRGVYVLGTRGGVLGVCTGDIRYPLKFEPILNFNGIYSKDNCISNFYHTEQVYAYTKSGLQVLRGSVAQNVYPDWSDALKRNRWTSLTEFDENLPSGKQHIQENDEYYTGYLEIRDTPLVECYKPIVMEEVDDFDCNIQVTNLSPRYVTIGYANRKRLAVIDLYHERSTVLHFEHSSVFPEGDAFSIVQNGVVQNVVKDLGVGTILYNDFHEIHQKLMTANIIKMFGLFRGSPHQEISFRIGNDMLHTNSIEFLEIAKSSNRELMYTGFFRYKYASFVIPFQGRLNSLYLST